MQSTNGKQIWTGYLHLLAKIFGVKPTEIKLTHSPIIKRKEQVIIKVIQRKNNKKLILWDGKELFLKIQTTDEIVTLGAINTRNGQLTRVQKLKAVQFTGQWIEI